MLPARRTRSRPQTNQPAGGGSATCSLNAPSSTGLVLLPDTWGHRCRSPHVIRTHAMPTLHPRSSSAQFLFFSGGLVEKGTRNRVVQWRLVFVPCCVVPGTSEANDRPTDRARRRRRRGAEAIRSPRAARRLLLLRFRDHLHSKLVAD